MRSVIAHVHYQEEMKGAEEQGSRGLLRWRVEEEDGFTEQYEERRAGQEAGVDSSQVQLLMSADHEAQHRKLLDCSSSPPPSSALPTSLAVQPKFFVTFFFLFCAKSPLSQS